ncbi:ankyrin repeat-containing domain protein [Aspergillus karnatakaensis]|uniref:ankyrin repeat domain-containing protein n=1 Tax=Aspergillus karnatakaensis TaxID=1810916 RepID=UPI003CCE26E5
MNLLDLPLEIFHLILAEVIDLVHCQDFTELQLVNKTFAREAQKVLFLNRQFRSCGNWNAMALSYLRYRVLAPDADLYYATRTVRQCTDWIIGASPTANPQQPEKLCYALCHSVICRGTQILQRTFTGLDCNFTETQKRQGEEQASDAPEHRLCAAACIGRLDLVQSLVDQGVDVNVESDIYGAPLWCAARGGHLPVVQWLLHKGADSYSGAICWREGDKETIVDHLRRMNGGYRPYTALQAAAAAGHEELVRLFLEPPFNVSRPVCSLLHASISAARKGHANVLRVLLASVDITTITQELFTMALDIALKKSADQGHLECMRCLLDAGAPVNSYYYNAGVPSTAWWAATNGQNEAIELLLERGADINADMRFTDGPLAGACCGGFPRTVALLLDRGARLVGEMGESALRRTFTGEMKWQRMPYSTMHIDTTGKM